MTQERIWPGRSGVHGREPAGPRRRLLELAGDTDEEVLAAVVGDELDPYREPLGRDVERERSGRLPGHVELAREAQRLELVAVLAMVLQAAVANDDE